MKYLTIAVILLTLSSCKQKVGGPCEYTTLSEEVGISEIIEENGAIQFVMFSAGDASEVRSYKFSMEDLNSLDTTMDFQKIQQERQGLILEMEQITSGTCTPLILKNITIKD